MRVTASIPVACKAYSVHVNLAAQTRRDGRFDGTDKRPLTADELRVCWRLIEKLPGLRGRCDPGAEHCGQDVAGKTLSPPVQIWPLGTKGSETTTPSDPPGTKA